MGQQLLPGVFVLQKSEQARYPIAPSRSRVFLGIRQGGAEGAASTRAPGPGDREVQEVQAEDLPVNGGRNMATQYTQDGLIVPYITLWSAERWIRPRLEKRYGPHGPFLGYRDEHAYDRDGNGALWARCSTARGKGRARFELVHSLRQRNAMLRSLCQVCGTALLNSGQERTLFLVRGIGQPIAEGERTGAPPVCEGCAPIASRDCPHLRAGHAAAWVTRALVWGVAGTVYDLDTLQPMADMDLVDVPYTSPLIRQVIAHRMVETLHGCTPVDLDTLRPAEPVAP